MKHQFLGYFWQIYNEEDNKDNNEENQEEKEDEQELN
jgi:cbb3-type cytochrome oxidase subunit 3